jgi:hypothetical protein
VLDREGFLGYVAAMVAALPMILSGCSKDESAGHSKEQYTHRHLQQLHVFLVIRAEKPGRSLPIGGTQALEVWLRGECKDEVVAEYIRVMFTEGEAEAPIVQIGQDGEITLRDVWGHALIYRHPSGTPGGSFRLYSVGPNGYDEDGKGDDIEPVVKDK